MIIKFHWVNIFFWQYFQIRRSSADHLGYLRGYSLRRNNITIKMHTYKVACFGAGFVGIPTSSVLALKNPDKKVITILSSLLFMISTKHALNYVSRINLIFMSKDWSMWWLKLTIVISSSQLILIQGFQKLQ